MSIPEPLMVGLFVVREELRLLAGVLRLLELSDEADVKPLPRDSAISNSASALPDRILLLQSLTWSLRLLS